MEEIKLNLENLTDEERSQLIALVEKANKPKSKVWKPEINDEYLYITSDACIRVAHWTGGAFDKIAYEIGNVYKTKEEAEEEVTRRKVLTQLKRLSIESGEDENPWNGIAKHWCCDYDLQDNKMRTFDREFCKTSEIFFPSEKSILDAIQEIGEDNVKRYILGVKDE